MINRLALGHVSSRYCHRPSWCKVRAPQRTYGVFKLKKPSLDIASVKSLTLSSDAKEDMEPSGLPSPTFAFLNDKKHSTWLRSHKIRGKASLQHESVLHERYACI